MTRMAIDLKKLRHIVEVARSKGITLAAYNLGITQSALTRSVADVEAELGLSLFQRLPRGVQVTDVGRDFIAKSRRIIGDFDDLVGSVTDYRELNTGKLRIGFSPGAFQKFFSPALIDFIADYPGIRVELFHGSAENQSPQLLSGELDIILGSARQFARWPELDVQPVRDLHCRILVRKGHPITKYTKPTLQDLLKFPWMQASSIEPIDSDLMRVLNKEGGKLVKPHYFCDDFDLARSIIKNTDAACPVFYTDPEFGHLKGQFSLLDNILEIPTHALAVMRSKSKHLTPAAEVFITYVEKSLKSDNIKIKNKKGR